MTLAAPGRLQIAHLRRTADWSVFRGIIHGLLAGVAALLGVLRLPE
jgi:hypothetical protein